MSKIQSLPRNALDETPSSPGIRRHLAFKGEDFLVVRARSEPGKTSGWHHHGEYDVYGYLVSGSARFETNGEKGDAISLNPGDFFHVPHHTVTEKSIHQQMKETSSSCFFAEQALWFST